MSDQKRKNPLPKGVYEKAGRYYCRPTDGAMREVFAARFSGKKSISLGGGDAKEMRLLWKEYFNSDPIEDGERSGTVGELITRYELDVLPKIPASTRETELCWLPNLRRAFGFRLYAKSEHQAVTGDYIRSMHVQAYVVSHATDRPVAANRELSTLRKIFRYARGWGLTEFNPTIGIQRNPESPRDTYIDDKVLLDIYQKAHPVLQCMIDIAQMFGCRPGEARGLRDEDLLDDGVLLRPLKGKRGQPQKPRIYNWIPKLIEVIERAKELRTEILLNKKEPYHPFLFLTPNGEPYTKDGLCRVWSRTVLRAGYNPHDYHLNDVRAKTGSDVYAAGKEAADHLGHVDSRTTRRVYDRLPRRIEPWTPISGGKK